MAVRLSWRARVILPAAAGWQNRQIGQQLRVGRDTVTRWRKRFALSGIAGIEKDAPRPGRKPKITQQKIQEIVRRTTQEKPALATPWSARTMARAVGVSEASVRRIWRRHGLKPHRIKRFKLSNNPHFAEKVEYHAPQN